MPDDFVLNLRQPAQYPALGSAQNFLLFGQASGLGGAVGTVTAQAVVQAGFTGPQSLNGPLFVSDTISVPWLTAQNADVRNLMADTADVRALMTNGAPVATVDDISVLRAATVQSVNGRAGDVWLSILDIAGGAPIDSPRFTGSPVAPDPAIWSNSNRIATTSFVHGSIIHYIDSVLSRSLVLSFNGRGGHVCLTADDVEDTGVLEHYAKLHSPHFNGHPTAPTAPEGTSNAQIATTAFVMGAVMQSVTGVSSFNGRTGAVDLNSGDITIAGGALLSSPAFTGAPTAPTPPATSNDTSLATTAFVNAAISGLSPGGPVGGVTSFNTRVGPVTLNSTDITQAGGALANAVVTSFNNRQGVVTLLANDISAVGGALLSSPAFTGLPTAPTAAQGASSTNPTQIATLAYVQAAIAGLGGAVGITSFNGRTAPAATLQASDVTGVGGVVASGTATTGMVPTQTASGVVWQALPTGGAVTLLGDVTGPSNSTTVAAIRGVATPTTAPSGAGMALTTSGAAATTWQTLVNSFNGRTGAVTFTAADITNVGGALQSWVTTQLGSYATTTWVTSQLAAYATQSWVTTQLASYATQSWVQSGFLPLAGGVTSGPVNIGNWAPTPANIIHFNAIAGDITLGGVVGYNLFVTTASPPTFQVIDGSLGGAGFVGVQGYSAGNPTPVLKFWMSPVPVTTGQTFSNQDPAFDSAMTLDGAGGLEVAGNISADGQVYAGGVALTSDAALKTDLREFYSEGIIELLKVWDFAWVTGGRSLGMIAQEVQKVFPQAVSLNERRQMWSIDYGQMVALLLLEVKSLRRRVARLEEPPIRRGKR